MNSFPIGTSALTTGRVGLDLIGQNIANAATPGYRRQSLNLKSRTTGPGIGTGVQVTGFTRHEASALRTAVLTGNSQQSSAASQLDAQRQVETSLGEGENTADAKLTQLFNSFDRLSTKPSDTALRRQVVSSATEFARQLNASAEGIDRLRNDLTRQVAQGVDEVNSLTAGIADLNGRIYAIEVRGESANDLKDQRDQLIDDLSKKVDLRTVSTDYGVVNVIGRDTALVVADTPTKLAVGSNTGGQLTITVAGQTQPLRFDGGAIGGQLQQVNQDIPATRARLDTLATELARRVDKFQATGLGLNGPITQSVGTRPVTDPTQPLATQNLPIPLTNGTLTFSLTNTGTQARTTASIAIDPATMSLNDVAAAITAGTGGQVQASVVTPQNVLQLQAQPGVAFDFAGRPDSPPAAVFAPPTVADTDTAGALAAFGINGVFSGSGAGDLAVRPELTADPNKLAASRTGRSGDSTNLDRLSALRDQAVISGRTLNQDATDISAAVGVSVQSLDAQESVQAGVVRNLSAQEQAIVGVDINEEFVKLLDYQRMVEGASKFLSVVNTSLDAVLGILR